MTVHTILLPDRMRGREARSVLWDDEAGTVEGEHSDVPWMQRVLATPTPYDGLSGVGREFILEDPAHDPRGFLWLLSEAYWPILNEPLRSTLPQPLRDAELRPARPSPCLARSFESILTSGSPEPRRIPPID